MAGTTILCHSDCDGICAGALLLSRFPGSRIFFTKPVSFLSDFRNTRSGRIVIADIALNRPFARQFLDILKKTSAEVIYFDHHPLPKNITRAELEKNMRLFVHNTKASASELVYRNYQKALPRERVWLALYGAIGDYTEDTGFVQERMRNWDMRAIYFEVSTLVMGIKPDRFSGYDAKRNIVKALAEGRNPSEIKGLVEEAKNAVGREFEIYELVKRKAKAAGKTGYVLDLPMFGFRGPSALFAATVTNKPLGLAVHTRENHLDITMRSRNPNLKLNILAEKSSEPLGGSGGGHPHAAGARIPLGALKKFLENINSLL